MAYGELGPGRTLLVVGVAWFLSPFASGCASDPEAPPAEMGGAALSGGSAGVAETGGVPSMGGATGGEWSGGTGGANTGGTSGGLGGTSGGTGIGGATGGTGAGGATGGTGGASGGIGGASGGTGGASGGTGGAGGADGGTSGAGTGGTAAEGIAAISVLADHGFNYARIRILVEPPYTDALYQDLDYVIETARAADAAGMSILLDFFYSDGWADPGKQWKPASWSSDDFNTVSEKLRDHTTSVLNAMSAAGVLPDMVQVGNEVINGMVHPVGEITWNPDNFDNFVGLSSVGYDAVKSVADIPVMIQFAGDMGTAPWWFSTYLAAGGKADVLGVSFYAIWHGTISDAADALNALATHGKDTYIVETAAYWTPSRTGESTPAWPSTKQGQYDFLFALADAVNEIPRLQGIFYWGTTWAQEDEWFVEYPEWYAAEYPYDAEDRALFDTTPGNSIAVLNPGADAWVDAGGLAVRGVDVSEALIAQRRGVVFREGS